VRASEHAVVARPPLLRRYQLWILLGIVVLVLALFLVQAIADAYTNYLWYRSIGETMIWRSMVETKLGLALVFSGSFFLACWASLWAVDALAPVDMYVMPDYEIVRRYRGSVGRYPVTVRTVVSLLLALAVGVGTSSQWQHWLLFLNGGKFPVRDPQFGRNVGYYVFRLPFLSFLVDWSLVALLVLLIITALAHYLNGGLRGPGNSPRVSGHVVAHLSFILALMALVRAAAYFLVDRYALDLSRSGLVAGAGYTDVHVRLPALSVLAVVSMVAFVLLAYNVYHRTLVLPAVAVGLWAFIALMLGVIFPTFVQWLQVNASESTVEQPYIERNIFYTRYAFGLGSITPRPFAASSDMSANTVDANHETLDDLPLWSASVAGATYQDMQAWRSYYRLSGFSVDRYVLGSGVDRSITPVIVATREIDQSNLPRQTWVNQHLEYTHGYGVVMSPANAVSSSGQPQYAIGSVPVQSVPGAPRVKQPDIYFGTTSPSYVVVNTRQAELDYAGGPGSAPRTNHYSGSGGVQLTGFWQRAAFAMRFHDFNLLASRLITPRSRIVYLQNVVARVQHAVPFLKVDTHPYPVVAGGQVFWMLDCYTTTDYFPYSEDAMTGLLSQGSGLQGQYNYVRNSVEAVVNAYTGQVKLYVIDPGDPVLIAWEHTYPGLFLPLRAMAALTPGSRDTLVDHMRYPQDLLTVMSGMYGRYHFNPANANSAAQFYGLQDAWTVAAGTDGGPYVPQYEFVRLPGASSVSFVAVEPLVPLSMNGRGTELAGFVTASSSPSSYGTLSAFELPRLSASALGPAAVATRIQDYPKVSQRETLLSESHTSVVFGPPLLVPIEDSLLYIQALYVTGSNHWEPVLGYVATDFGGDAVGLAPTLVGSLQKLFGVSVSGIGPPGSQSLESRISQDLALAYAAYQRSVVDGRHFRLGALQRDLRQMGQYLQAAHQLVAEQQHGGRPVSSGSSSSSSTTTSSTTTSTTVAGSSSPSSSVGSGASNAPASGSSPPPAGTASTTTSTTLGGA
jgi:uncharacterized membrane protein (UPF0182 family)